MFNVWPAGDPIRIEDDGIVLREWAAGDENALVALYDTHEMDLRTPVPAPFDRAVALRYIEAAHQRRTEHGSWQLAITEDDDVAIGEVLAGPVEQDGPTYELAYAIAAAQQGRGLGRRALQLVIDRLADAGPATARLLIAEDNTVSRRVAESTGFERTDLPPVERTRKGRTIELRVWERAL